MNKEIDCKEVGLDCEFTACGPTEEETLYQLGQHILAAHGIQGFSKEFYNRARAAIHEGGCSIKQADPEACTECDEECFSCDECCC